MQYNDPDGRGPGRSSRAPPLPISSTSPKQEQKHAQRNRTADRYNGAGGADAQDHDLQLQQQNSQFHADQPIRNLQDEPIAGMVSVEKVNFKFENNGSHKEEKFAAKMSNVDDNESARNSVRSQLFKTHTNSLDYGNFTMNSAGPGQNKNYREML